MDDLTVTKKSKKKSEERDNTSPYLIWLDMEMSGLNPDIDVILEVAIVITDAQLYIVDKLDSIVIHQDDNIILNMDSWNTSTHTKSGLIDKIKLSNISVSDAEQSILSFIKQYVKKGSTLLCGNTIYQDRKFIIKYMPEFESYLHYRLIDVSTLKELAKRWYPNIPAFEKHNKHEALADVIESIEELKHYRKHMMVEIKENDAQNI